MGGRSTPMTILVNVNITLKASAWYWSRGLSGASRGYGRGIAHRRGAGAVGRQFGPVVMGLGGWKRWAFCILKSLELLLSFPLQCRETRPCEASPGL